MILFQNNQLKPFLVGCTGVYETLSRRMYMKLNAVVSGYGFNGNFSFAATGVLRFLNISNNRLANTFVCSQIVTLFNGKSEFKIVIRN